MKWMVAYYKLGKTVKFNDDTFDTYHEAEQRAVDLNRVESYLAEDIRREYFAVPEGQADV